VYSYEGGFYLPLFKMKNIIFNAIKWLVFVSLKMRSEFFAFELTFFDVNGWDKKAKKLVNVAFRSF
jgi:hypothetical protein